MVCTRAADVKQQLQIYSILYSTVPYWYLVWDKGLPVVLARRDRPTARPTAVRCGPLFARESAHFGRIEGAVVTDLMTHAQRRKMGAEYQISAYRCNKDTKFQPKPRSEYVMTRGSYRAAQAPALDQAQGARKARRYADAVSVGLEGVEPRLQGEQIWRHINNSRR